MYSNLYDEHSPFADMYVDVTENNAPEKPISEAKPTSALSSIFSKLGGENNLITLLILAFLLFDAEEDERLIILALALFMGI